MTIDLARVNPTALDIIEILNINGFQTVLAGGAVRDLILGVEPNDWDIATEADPDRVADILSTNLFDIKEVGKSFGVVLARRGDQEFEIATFRTETGFTDGRHPDHVEFSNIVEDSHRRDLTINALFMDMNGQILDFVNGLKDITNKTLRFVGDPNERIAEDKLRILRAIRFAVRFDTWILEWDTMVAIAKNSKELVGISAERITQELQKMIECHHPVLMMDLLVSTGLMEVILPEVAVLVGCTQNPKFHPEGDVFTHTKLVMEHLKDESFELQMAGMLHDIGKFDTWQLDELGDIRSHGHDHIGAFKAQLILERLKFSNEQTTHIVSLIRDHMKVHAGADMKRSTLRRLIAQPHFVDLVKLGLADIEASNNHFDSIDFIIRKAAEFGAETKLPDPLVTGKDLIDLGLKPGPNFKILLQAVMDLQLEGIITTKEEGLTQIREADPID
jgi:tRNA nucleotidyltransferase/poly(A) polymerase